MRYLEFSLRPRRTLLLLIPGFVLWGQVAIADLPSTLSSIKPGIVGVGTFMALRQQQDLLMGTGFVVWGGNHAITNSHVVPRLLDEGRRETVALYLPPKSNRVRRRNARVIKRDIIHDLCLLRFDGPPLHALRLGRTSEVREGQLHAFTGFPILNALWLYPVTHQGIVSSISPVAFPPDLGSNMDPARLSKLMRPFVAFRLDATAYPGNSGSPVYDTGTGRVVGVINAVQTRAGKESAISDPSGISFAIPVRYVRKLLEIAGLRD